MGNKARKCLEKFGANSEENSGENPGRKFEKFGELSFCNFSDLRTPAKLQPKSPANPLRMRVEVATEIAMIRTTAISNLGHTLSTAGHFPEEIPEKFGKTPETLSQRFLEFPSRVRLGPGKPFNQRHLKIPEHFQNYLPPSTARGVFFFFRSGSGEGLSELVMEFPTVLSVFLKIVCGLD